jgi:hypothetical protein
LAKLSIKKLCGPFFLLYWIASSAGAAAPIVFESPENQVSVLELYTSHGCSSCPPADAWLSRFVDSPGLWSEFIPLGFHVDYWNDLGWPDRFASKTYSDRQREYARQEQLSSVYTPGFVLRGKEWRGWFRRSPPALESGEHVGKMRLELSGDSHAQIRFEPTAPLGGDRLTLHVAILGFGLSTDVGAGENRGRTLEEDFVVLGYHSAKPSSVSGEWDLALPSVVPATTTRRAIAAWVSVEDDLTPLQAVGGWLP